MLDSWSANGTVAKIKYIHGRMFTKENYHEMLMRRTVPEAADYLAHSARYKDAFRDVDPNTVHRGFVERISIPICACADFRSLINCLFMTSL